VEWQKAPDALVRAFDRALPDEPRVERRAMFGYPCAFVGGNMFAGLRGADLIVRLPPDARATLLEMPGARIFEPIVGQPMRAYAIAPDTMIADTAALRDWVTRAFAYAAMLPPKASKPGKGVPTTRHTENAGRTGLRGTLL
jgi:TfoX N-terminal domain